MESQIKGKAHLFVSMKIRKLSEQRKSSAELVGSLRTPLQKTSDLAAFQRSGGTPRSLLAEQPPKSVDT
jgi:hypothetical protein